MKRLITCIFLILVSCIFAGAVVAYGLYENKMANAEESFATFDFPGADSIYQEIEGSLEYGTRFPGFLNGWRKDIREHRRAGQYWQKRYVELIKEASGSVGPSEGVDPNAEFITANSFYRIVQGEKDKKKVLEFLDRAVSAYRNVVADDPANFNAAYNYEYLLQTRNSVSSGKRTLPLNQPNRLGKSNPGKEPSEKGDQPGSEPGIHGQEGASPKEAMDKIKIHIPTAPDESKGEGGDDAGKGDLRRRRG